MLTRSDFAEPINIGSSELVTINELVDTAENIAGIKLKRSERSLDGSPRRGCGTGWRSPTDGFTTGSLPSWEWHEPEFRRVDVHRRAGLVRVRSGLLVLSNFVRGSP
jgi:nucleoside-diphosphate-sugar epimerase